MRYTVTAPDLQFAGEVAGVAFLNGEGQVEDSNRAALAYFARRGYTVVREATEAATEAVEAELKRPAGNAARADWVAYAIGRGLSEEDAEKATVKELQELTKEES